MSLNRSPLENGDQCSTEWEVILFNMGQTYRKLGAYEQALTFYSRALRLKPDTPSTMSSKAHVHLLLEEYDKAIALCESVLNYNSNDQFTCLMLNYALEELQHQPVPFNSPVVSDYGDCVEQSATSINISADMSMDLLDPGTDTLNK